MRAEKEALWATPFEYREQKPRQMMRSVRARATL
jgi:hypothetical protein